MRPHVSRRGPCVRMHSTSSFVDVLEVARFSMHVFTWLHSVGIDMARWRVPPPPLMAIQSGELRSVAAWEVRGRDEVDLVDATLEEAMRGPLSPRRKRELAAAVAAGRAHVERWSCEQMEKLVEHNPEVLVEALCADQGTGDATRMALVAMDVSLASLELVHTLVSRGAMTEEYVLVHLLNCLERCREGEEGSGRNRKVRLFCLYLQKMIRDGLVDGASKVDECEGGEPERVLTHWYARAVHEALVDLQAFCIEFSRVPEAVQLYRLVKSLV